MYLKSVRGDTLFKSSYVTIKESVEEAVSEGVCLDYINLRKANLVGAHMDMAKMHGACLWGADLTSADMSDGCFDDADFRTVILKDACISDGSFINANFHGAYCSQMLVDGADLSGSKFSCPSIFSCDLVSAKSLKNSTYSHHGEIDCPLSDPPIVIRGLDKQVVIMGSDILVGADHEKIGGNAHYQKEILDKLQKRFFYNHK